MSAGRPHRVNATRKSGRVKQVEATLTLEEWRARESASRGHDSALRVAQANREQLHLTFSALPISARREQVRAQLWEAVVRWANSHADDPDMEPGCLECEAWAARCVDHLAADRLSEPPSRGPGSVGRICAHCGTAFLAPKGRGRPSVTCSHVCAQAHRAQRWRASDKSQRA